MAKKINKFFILLSAFLFLMAENAFADVGTPLIKEYVPIQGIKICPADKEVDWPYDCNQCPPGYQAISITQKFIKRKGALDLGVMVVKCRKIIEDFEFKTISDLRKMPAGFYNSEGYLIWKSFCPPCPKGAECVKCLPPQIIISEKLRLNVVHDASSELTTEELLLQCKDGQQAKEIGARYKFSLEKRKTGEGFDYLLRGFSK